MRLSKTISILCASAALALGGNAALAQAAAGTKVVHTSGAEVGTVQAVEDGFYLVKTDKHEVRLPKASFTAHEGGFIMAMTRDQVNAAVEQSLASAAEKIVVGASITGSQGGAVGTIDALDDQFVTVKLASGKLVRLPRSGIAPGPNGPVIGMTVAELEAAAGAGTGAEAGAQ